MFYLGGVNSKYLANLGKETCKIPVLFKLYFPLNSGQGDLVNGDGKTEHIKDDLEAVQKKHIRTQVRKQIRNQVRFFFILF